MDAIIYIRFSTPRQEKGSSEFRQLENCRALIERMGWREVEIVSDLGVSAWKGDHLKSGNLGKLAKRIFNGDVPRGTVIVVEALDRLSRQKARVTQRWIEDVCDRGVNIATAMGEKVYDADNLDKNLMSLLEVLFIAEGANSYVETLSNRVKRSYEARLKQARIDNTAIGSQGPAWLKAVGKRPHIQWQPIPERARIVREIFDLTVGGHTPWGIAKIFNDRGEPSFTGKAWERTSIVNIIRNRAVEGDYVVGEGKSQKPTGEVLVGYYPAILPLDIIAEARKMMDRRRQQRPGKGRNSGSVNNLFGQAIRCGACGGRMAQMGYQNRYLVCYEANRANGCDQKTTFHYRPFEGAALDQILPLALDESFFRQAEASNHLGLEIAETQKAVSDARAEAERAYDMWDRTQSAIAERRFHDAEARMKDLQATLAALEGKLSAAQGVATAQAHLARVHGVREALTHPDETVRLPARLKVAEALRAIDLKVMCRIIGGERQFLMTTFSNGMFPLNAFAFDGKGTLIESLDTTKFVAERVAKMNPEELAELDRFFGGSIGKLERGKAASLQSHLRRGGKQDAANAPFWNGVAAKVG